MFRALVTYAAISVLVFAGLTLAEARGANHDIGQDVVICSGAGMITIALPPDGPPQERTEPCPDGTSIFAASFALPGIATPEARLLTLAHAPPAVLQADRHELSPTARGPPRLA